MPIKIKQATLLKKSTKDLLKMKKEMELHLLEARNKKDKGFNIKEEKRNLARLNTLLKVREMQEKN